MNSDWFELIRRNIRRHNIMSQVLRFTFQHLLYALIVSYDCVCYCTNSLSKGQLVDIAVGGLGITAARFAGTQATAEYASDVLAFVTKKPSLIQSYVILTWPFKAPVIYWCCCVFIQ